MQNKRRYVNFENGSHFICSFNLNNLETTIFIVFKITGIVSGDQEIVNSLIGNSVVDNGKLKINAKHISFYKTHSGGLGLGLNLEHLVVLLAGPISHTSTRCMDFVEIFNIILDLSITCFSHFSGC